MRRRPLSQRPRGMSVIEILIAYTVLLVAVLALLGSLPMAAQQHSSGVTANQALYYAEQKMDELIRNDTKISTSGEFQDLPLNDNTMVRTWKGEIGNDTAVETITVKVTWLTEHGQREVVLRSYVHI
ncbi:MAG: hypothetical protein Q4F00_06545 [bacterium]|nr:hypothetical protein [bacterium]